VTLTHASYSRSAFQHSCPFSITYVVLKDQSTSDAFVNGRNIVSFNGEELLPPRPSPMIEDHPLSPVHDRLFNIFAATFYIGGRSSRCNLTTRHAVMTADPLITALFYSNAYISLAYEAPGYSMIPNQSTIFMPRQGHLTLVIRGSFREVSLIRLQWH
jgi:hypothetical protein